MNYNIVQEYLINKRGFELFDKPVIHYKKAIPLTDKLSVNLIIVFKDYDITFGKYLYFENFCCFALADEKTHSCQNVTQLFDLVKVYDQPVKASDIKQQLSAYEVTARQRLSTLSQENSELVQKVSTTQRSVSMFTQNTSEWKGLTNKLNFFQGTLNRNNKEVDILSKVINEIKTLTNGN